MRTFLPLLAALLLSACAQANAPADPPQTSAATPAATASATPSVDKPAADVSAVQRALAANGVEITGTLDAPKGYQGFVATYQGHQLPVYVTPDGRHILVGTLFDMDGHDLTSSAMAKIEASPFSESQWKELESATWVVEGNPRAKRIVYVFVDTRCPYCHHLWRDSQPFVKAGNVQVRDILVGVIAPESLPEAAKILDAKDPAAAWNRNEQNFGKNPAPGDHASPESIAKIHANTDLMQKLGFRGTPSVIWKDDDGRIHTLQGMPRDPEMLKAVFGG
ncbi:MAG: thiol:disulfide interchange protein DsbG [Rhodanobacteraceae bacterium]